jgi:hypothetical protein
MLLFVVLGLFWFVAGGLVVGTLFSGIPSRRNRTITLDSVNC